MATCSSSRREADMAKQEGEGPEVAAFFRHVHGLKRAEAARAARECAAALDAPEEALHGRFLAAINHAFFGLFTAIDRVGGPDDFPEIELTLPGNKSLNADFLHDLYVEHEPEDDAQAIERAESAATRAPIVMDEK